MNGATYAATHFCEFLYIVKTSLNDFRMGVGEITIEL